MEELKKILREQLQLLAEKSKGTKDAGKLVALTGAMMGPVSQLVYFEEQERQSHSGH